MKITLKLLKKGQQRSKATEIFTDQEFGENQTLSDIFEKAKGTLSDIGDTENYKFQYGSNGATEDSNSTLKIDQFLGKCGATVCDKSEPGTFVLYLVMV